MALAEIVIINLGSAIAKSILEIWLKNNDPATDVSSTMIDLLRERVPNVLERKRGERQFAAIGENVAASLMPLFSEAILSEDSREAVAIAVAKTLNSSSINSQIIVKADLDPAALAQHLLNSNGDLVIGFSEDELEFYRRIVEKSAEHIVDIASILPNFKERALGEILSRESMLVDMVNELLRNVLIIREETRQDNDVLEYAVFEEKYRLAVMRNLDRVQIFGVDVSRANQSQNLSVSYISLLASQSRTRDSHGEEGNKVVKSVEDIIARTERLLVRGMAGSGKTTLLKWIAVNCARRSLTGQLIGYNDKVPFWIPLRQYVDSELPPPERFPQLVAPLIAGTTPKGWVQHCCDSGRAIILVDSVDEVPRTQRNNVRSWLNDLVATYPKCNVIVTSRPSAIEEGWMGREQFDDAELQPMELSDVYVFIDHWHRAVREELSSDQDKAILNSLATKLKRKIEDNSQLRRLASNPLLCAVLCAVHRERHEQLPVDRIELYESLCNMLIIRRDQEQHLLVEERDYPALTYRQRRALLEDFAYWMIRNGWSSVTVSEADKRFQRKLANMGEVSQDSTAVRRLFVDRSGMLRDLTVDRIDFTHRTLQEFLAAKAIVDDGDIGLLIKNAHDDQWREVIVLAAGLAGLKSREDIVNGIISRGDQEHDRRYQLHLLAVACLETTVELSSVVRDNLTSRLALLVPPRDMADAQAISSAHELAIPFLKFNDTYSETESAACVRAVSMIGGTLAFEVLKSYQRERRQLVLQELVRAADSFDRDKFFKEVLSPFELRHLCLQLVKSLSGMQYLTTLESLELHLTEEVDSLAPLAGLTKLASLRVLKAVRVRELSPLTGLINLTELSLHGFTGAADIGSLARLTNLTKLVLQGFDKVSDLSALAELRRLSELALVGTTPNAEFMNVLPLWGFERVTDLSPLVELTSLTHLKLRGFGAVTDLSPLATLSSLMYLSLQGFDLVTDFSPLEKLTKLDLYIVWGFEDSDEGVNRWSICDSPGLASPAEIEKMRRCGLHVDVLKSRLKSDQYQDIQKVIVQIERIS